MYPDELFTELIFLYIIYMLSVVALWVFILRFP
jgi:hypothetical protein